MALIQKHLEELEQLRKDFIDKKVSIKEIQTQLLVYSQEEKRMHILLHAKEGTDLSVLIDNKIIEIPSES